MAINTIENKVLDLICVSVNDQVGIVSDKDNLAPALSRLEQRH